MGIDAKSQEDFLDCFVSLAHTLTHFFFSLKIGRFF